MYKCTLVDFTAIFILLVVAINDKFVG